MCLTHYKIHRKPFKDFTYQQVNSFVPVAPVGRLEPIHFRKDIHEYWPTGDAGKRYVFAPCGQCEDCRNANRFAWAWRLVSEVQYYMRERDYHMGFITLTYNDNMLPRFPSIFGELSGMPCFSRDDTHKLILYVRKMLHREYAVTDLVYFLASEYGPKTQRPHYHMVIAWPSVGHRRVMRNGKYIRNPDGSYFRTECPLPASVIHSLIAHYWSEPVKQFDGTVRPALGFVSPKDLLGGQSLKSGKKILPFEVTNLNDALNGAFYTAKYVTKDFYFMRDVMGKLTDSDIYRYMRSAKFRDENGCNLNDFLPHHIQSKSLGFESIAHLTDVQRLDLLLRGRCLLGSDHLSMPPMYIQNKILFKPCYLIQADGTRVVKRELTQFYKDNCELILRKKFEYYDMLFRKMSDNQYWLSTGIDSSFTLYDISLEYKDVFGGRLNGELFLKELKSVGLDSSVVYSLGEFVRNVLDRDFLGMPLSVAYVVYYGVPQQYCFSDYLETFKNRYRHPAYVRSWDTLDYRRWCRIQWFFGYVLRYMQWQHRSVPDENADFVRDDANQLVG